MTRRSRPRPHELVVGEWPNGNATSPPARVAQAVARGLAGAVDGRSLRAVEAVTGVDRTTVGKVLRGETWADMATIANLEDGLGVCLWPVRSSQP